MKNDREISNLKQGSKFLLWKSIFQEQRPKSQCSRCWKKINNHGKLPEGKKLTLFLKAPQLWGLERNYSFLALGSDILTPWHQKLNWPFCHLPNAIYSPAFREFESIWEIWIKKVKTWKKKENFQFQIKGLISYSEEASSKNREQNLNAQGAEKISTTMANCQKVKSSFSFCKQLNYEVWKEIIHFWHWAVISSHPDTRNWTDPFVICLMVFIVQHTWKKFKKFWQKKFKIYFWHFF